MHGSQPARADGTRRPRVISMFSGMEAASVAADPFGWEFVALAEVEPAACWTLHHHYGSGRPVYMPRPEDATTAKEAKERGARIKAVAALPEAYPGSPVNLGDMTQVDWEAYRGQIDVVVGGPPCFPSGTLILSKRGLIPIEDIVEGDEVLTHKKRWRRVVATMSRQGETVLLKGQGHWGLETTAEHPFWARGVQRKWKGGRTKSDGGHMIMEPGEIDWVEAKDMRGMYWSAPLSIPLLKIPALDASRPFEGRNMPNAIDEAFMWFVGAWVGDGWLRTDSRRDRPEGQSRGGVLLCGNKKHRDEISYRLGLAGLRYSVSEDRTTVRFEITSKPLVRWLEESFGRGCEGKTIPAWLMSARRSLREAFLDGYLFADGHTSTQSNGKGRVRRFTTINRSLAIGIRLIANSLGLSASIVRSNVKRDTLIEGRRVSEKPFFQVSVYDRARSAFADEGMMWGKVRSVVSTGRTAEVFNFEVEEDNSYVADGIVVHNCQAFSFAGLRKSMDDDRGNLSLAYVRAIHAIRPLWSFTENVPGWLTTKDNAFGCYLGALVGADSPLEPPNGKRWGSAGVVDGPLYRAAWRILDAQGFVPQRRRRVFVVAARVGTGGNPVSVLWESQAEVERNLGERARGGPLFPVRKGGERNPGSSGQEGQGASEPADAGLAGGGGEGLNGDPVAYRLHAAFSTAMTSSGKARAADPVEVARALDTCGGFAANQGGNVVVQGRSRSLAGNAATADGEWIPETATTLRARDAKGSPDSDCTQTLLAVREELIAFHGRQDPVPGAVSSAVDTDGYSLCVAVLDDGSNRLGRKEADALTAERRAIAFDVRNGVEIGEMTGTVQSHHTSYSLNAQPVVCVPGEIEDPVFLHCNKGRPAGRKSAHVEMVSAKPIVETLTTDGHSQSAVAVPAEDGRAVQVSIEGETPPNPIAFSAKDYGGDAGPIAPTLRAAPHHGSHANSGSHVGIVIPKDAPEATVYDDPRRFDTKGIHGGGSHGEVHPTLESTNPKQNACIRDDVHLEAYATETGQGFWNEREPTLRVTTAPSQAQTIVKQIDMLVRRLTPTECLALQGFPRDYLDGVMIRGKNLADGPRYKLCGNSWAIPVIAWVFGRLDESLARQHADGERP